jgi:hypothetical protein
MLLGFVELDFFATHCEQRSSEKENRSFKFIYFLYQLKDISASFSKTINVSIGSSIIG